MIVIVARWLLTIFQIIDGFGSYVDDFMQCDVFRGIGGTAHKYYMLFQHHLPPPPSTYTSGMTASLTFAATRTDLYQTMPPLKKALRDLTPISLSIPM
jgi:hypothetical protein